MSELFISYHHASPDQELALFLQERLRAKGHNVFLDTQIRIGRRWALEIERTIVTAEFFLVLISASSICSDMVRQEVRLAHDLNQKSGKPIILPVRLEFRGELPYDLAAYLDPIKYIVWNDGEGFENLTAQLSDAIECFVALPEKGKTGDDYSIDGVRALASATEQVGVPLPVADPRFALETGTVWLDSPFYVMRGSDFEIKEHLRILGSTIVVSGARQMGKSSLLARACLAEGYQPLYIDFQLMAEQNFKDLDSLLRYVAHKLAKLAKTTVTPDEFWDDKAGPIESITGFIEGAILGEDLSVLILFDEADMIFKCDYRDQFFSAVRAWHNRRATSNTWKRLSLVIAHSTDPYLWIQDINRSPFNVGYPIKLEEFDFEEICGLNSRYGAPLKTEADVQQLVNLVGGQPYLVRQALYRLSVTGWSMSFLKEVAADEEGPFGDHLHRFVWSLHREPELKKSLRQVIKRGSCDDERYFQRLKAAGLIRGDARGFAEMRCLLYKRYFDKHL
jgi:AAA domain-containing protein/TIR domain-containing protein